MLAKKNIMNWKNKLPFIVGIVFPLTMALHLYQCSSVKRSTETFASANMLPSVGPLEGEPAVVAQLKAPASPEPSQVPSVKSGQVPVQYQRSDKGTWSLPEDVPAVVEVVDVTPSPATPKEKEWADSRPLAVEAFPTEPAPVIADQAPVIEKAVEVPPAPKEIAATPVPVARKKAPAAVKKAAVEQPFAAARRLTPPKLTLEDRLRNLGRLLFGPRASVK